MAMRTVRRMSGSASKPWRPIGKHPSACSRLRRVSARRSRPARSRRIRAARRPPRPRRSWRREPPAGLARSTPSDGSGSSAHHGLRWARSGVAGGAEVVDRLLQAVAQGLGAVPFRQLDPISRDVAGGPVPEGAARRVRVVVQQNEAARPVRRPSPAQWRRDVVTVRRLPLRDLAALAQRPGWSAAMPCRPPAKEYTIAKHNACACRRFFQDHASALGSAAPSGCTLERPGTSCRAPLLQ
jgi:hypothetical protein